MSLLEDARNIQRKDPAARSVLEVILLYPGFHILVYHRIAHWLYEHGHFFLARWVSQHGRHKTGIEIHPGARIGKCLFIFHFGSLNISGVLNLKCHFICHNIAFRCCFLQQRISAD